MIPCLLRPALPLAPDHLASLAVLEALTSEHPWGAPALAQTLAQPPARLVSVLPSCFLPVVDTPPIAYALVSQLGPEAELLQLATHPAHRRCGLARALLLHVCQTLSQAGVARLFLEVRRGNQPAVSLYQQLGFQIDRVRPGYYPSESHQKGPDFADFDALVMSLSVPDDMSAPVDHPPRLCTRHSATPAQ